MSSDNKTTKYNGKTVLASLAYFLLITAFFYLLIVQIMPPYVDVPTMEQLEQTDLSANFVRLGSGLAERYRGKLYEPSDFTGTELPSGDSDAKYMTLRIMLNIPAGKTYGITGLTAAYSQKVYVNGQLLSTVGQVSDNEEDFVPKTDYYTIYFMPETDTTEIVIQLAHFNHRSGHLNNFYLAEQQVIAARNRMEFLADGLVLGVSLTIAIFFFGMFLFNRKRMSFLWFSLSCFCSAVHYSIFHNKDIMVLLPDLSWYISHKAEAIAMIGFYVFLLIFVVSMLRLNIAKPIKYIFLGLFACIMLYYIFLPSTVYSEYIYSFIYFSLAMLFISAFYIVWRAISERAFAQWENIIVVFSLLLVLTTAVMEGLTYFNRSWYFQPYSTMLIIFFNAITLTMHFRRTEQELTVAQIKQQEISEHNAMLKRVSNMKTEFLANTSHEMRTPLTVMSVGIQTAAEILSDGEMTPENKETIALLNDAQSEIIRLSRMVGGMLSLNSLRAGTEKMRFDFSQVLKNTSDMLGLILSKRANKIQTDIEDNLILYGDTDLLAQALINIIQNANAHTTSDTIILSAKLQDDKISVCISDNGSGIAPELLPHVFERGVSDGGTGVGLYLCKTIVQSHGGDIWIESEPGKGTQVHFTLPIYEGQYGGDH